MSLIARVISECVITGLLIELIKTGCLTCRQYSQSLEILDLFTFFFIYDQTPASFISFALRLMTDGLVWEKRTAICCPYAHTTRRHVREGKVQISNIQHWIVFVWLFVSVVFSRVRKNCERLQASLCLI